MGAGSVSLRLYPHTGLTANAIIDELTRQAVLADTTGFDGVMTSEHHGGFAGYLPNPLQVTGWMLEAMPGGWAAPCPLLLPLRPAALVAEEVAWLAARFPNRVGLGLAAGSRVEDFEIMDTHAGDLAGRFASGLATVSGMLSGRTPGRLSGDPAIERCRWSPVPVVSAAVSPTAARRAARNGVGLIVDSLSSLERIRLLSDSFRDAGGTAPTVLVRRVWLGSPPADEMARQLDTYRGYASSSAQSHWDGDQIIAGSDGASLARDLAAAAEASGSDALNLRVHAPGIAPAAVREQIEGLADVVARLRTLLLRRPA